MNKSTIYLVFILLFLYEMLYMMNTALARVESKTVAAGGLLLLLFLSLSICMLSNLKYISKETLFKGIPVFVVVMILQSFLHSKVAPVSSSIYIVLPYPLLAFFFGYIIPDYLSEEKYSRIMSWFAIGTFIAFIYTYTIMSSSIGDKIANSTYYLLYLLPFILMCRNSLLKTILIILIGFSVLVSFKRGGLISFALALLIYGWIDGKVQYNKHLISGKTIVYAFVLFIAIYGANLILDGYIAERFNNINESSRTELYPIVVAMIEHSSFNDLILGHGWNAVLRDNPLEYSAHNDVLECIYDFGLVGLLFYLSMIIGLIKLSVRSIKNCSKYSASLLSAIVIFIFQSMVSHIIIQITYFTLFALFFGYIYRQENRISNT